MNITITRHDKPLTAGTWVPGGGARVGRPPTRWEQDMIDTLAAFMVERALDPSIPRSPGFADGAVRCLQAASL